MTLDNEKQRKMLLEIINAVNFPGSALEDAHTLKEAIKKASLAKDDHSQEE